MDGTQKLEQILGRIDGKGYGAYKQIKGRWDMGWFTLTVDHVQADPFAAPSRARVELDAARTRLPESTWRTRSREVGLRSHLAQTFHDRARAASGRRGSGRSGSVEIMEPGQEMLETSAVSVRRGAAEARFTVGLPARGRRVLGRQAARLLCEDLPAIVRASLLYESLDGETVESWCAANEDQDALREALAARGLVSFVADGSILPRRSGVDDRPLRTGPVVPFRSPEELRVSFTLPNTGAVSGMGIPRGVTLIVGGGFHGKSCLLSAVELGVYNHRPGDGRELVATVPDTVKIRAEEGRRVHGVDISPFIAGLPYGQDTTFFCTENASGSTSQAASIIEALEAGCSLLLIDEDTAATNFMIRDHRMQELVSKEHEPITPFIDKARQLSDELGVSTILVIGGSGDYFDVADTVIAMDGYVPWEATGRARSIAERFGAVRRVEGGDRFGAFRPRRPVGSSIDPSKGRRAVKIKVRDVRTLAFGEQTIDLSAVSQLVHRGQTRALGEALVRVRSLLDGRGATVGEALDAVMDELRRSGPAGLSARPSGDLAAFRRFELAAALNRLRTLEVERGNAPGDRRAGR